MRRLIIKGYCVAEHVTELVL